MSPRRSERGRRGDLTRRRQGSGQEESEWSPCTVGGTYARVLSDGATPVFFSARAPTSPHSTHARLHAMTMEVFQERRTSRVARRGPA